MKLMEKILSQENLEMAIRKVKQNKGAPGIDRMTVQEIEYWFEKYQDELITKIMNMIPGMIPAPAKPKNKPSNFVSVNNAVPRKTIPANKYTIPVIKLLFFILTTPFMNKNFFYACVKEICNRKGQFQ